MMTTSASGEYQATCAQCGFEAEGLEAYYHRKAGAHARQHGHKMTIGLNGAHNK